MQLRVYFTFRTPMIHIYFLSVALRPVFRSWPLVSRSFQISDTAHEVGLLRTSDQTLRPLPDNTKHSKQTDIHPFGGIRTPIGSKRTDADPHLRLSDHGDGILDYILILSGDSQHTVVTGTTH